MKTSSVISICGALLAVGAAAGIHTEKRREPIVYTAQAIDKAVLCGQYCYPTVAYRSERFGLESREHGFAAYTATEVGGLYQLSRPPEPVVPLGLLVLLAAVGFLMTLVGPACILLRAAERSMQQSTEQWWRRGHH